MGKPRRPKEPTKPALSVVPDVVESGRSDEGPPDAEDAFNAKESAFVEALAEGQTIREASTVANVPYTTARRWRKRPQFQAAVRERAREAVDCGVRTLATSASAAAKALKDVAERGGTGDGPRVSAARACLELSIQSLKIDDVLERVEQLEARQGQQPGKPGHFRKGI